MSTLLRTIAELGMASQGAVNMHESAKHFHKSITGSAKPTKDTSPIGLTFSIPTDVKLNAPVLCTGTSPLGFVSIYSFEKKERTVDVGTDHKYYAMLFFSKVGYYELYAKYLDTVKSNVVEVTCHE